MRSYKLFFTVSSAPIGPDKNGIDNCTWYNDANRHLYKDGHVNSV